ncbi:hypothetical protein AALP_AA3G193000 [Arabis alpina]|uniref:TF-B3 domain-containing protein n=1 Tax=Arabis alpina TaxID=50452 RepID=A0A087HA87_ARAAL|nr:hypothetical protein AALP_AA3G193000 [Arabis alpina]
MGRKSGFDRTKEERKKLSFYKIFQSADLSSESMRAFPYNIVKSIPEEDFCYKMVIKAQWGSSWEVEVSKNPRFYYMEKLGWNQFVSDNALGGNEFVTFTHKRKMCFHVNIYEQNGKEIVNPRKPVTMASASRSRKEQTESIYKDVKKEEESCESMEEIDLGVPKKKAEEYKTSKKIKSKKVVTDVEEVELKMRKKMKSKKVVNGVEIGESSRGVERIMRKKKAEKSKTSKKKRKQKRKSKVENGIPEFTITIKKSYLKFLAIPKDFVEDHIRHESKMVMVHHPDGKGSWKALCLVRKLRTIFSRGWSKLAREYPLLIGDRVTFKLVEPTEFILVKSKKAKEEITP